MTALFLRPSDKASTPPRSANGCRGGPIGQTASKKAGSFKEALESQNRSDAYDWDEISPLVEQLLASEGAYWDFYSRHDICGLLK